jgi:methionine-rich copper-binding protein CopC/putative copper export protein
VANRLAIALLILVGAVLGPGVASVLGHAELIVSSPSDGEVLPAPPAEVRILFSEPIEAGFSSLDVTAADGSPVVIAAGGPDPADDHVLVATMPPMDDGGYRVVWRVLSKADGHAYVGTFSFVVASPGASVAPLPPPPGGPAPATGHHATLGTQGRILLYGGLLLAFGLAICAWLVLEPAMGLIPSVVGRAIGLGLILAGIGALLMLLASGLGLPGPTGRPDPFGYATSSRPGLLLLARVLLGIVGGAVVFLLARRGRVEPATDVGALAATAGIALTVGAGHAAVFEPPVTVAVWFVHACAAGVWMAGIGLVAVLASRRPVDPPLVRSVVVRYSALALVAVGLVVLTGAYQAWVELGGLPSLDDPYGRLLVVKLAVVAGALGLGLLNHLDGGRLLGWLGGLGRRATIEAFLAAVVIVVTASLVVIPPPGPGRPVKLAGETPAGGEDQVVALAISPGRPGPNRFIAVPAGTTVPTILRLEASTGAIVAETPFRAPIASGTDGGYVADVRDVPAGDIRAIVLAGADRSIGTFPFVMAPDGIATGAAVPPIDPGLLIGLAMLFVGLLAVAYARAGGRLARTDAAAARVALTGGGIALSVVGALATALGPRV